MSGGTNTTPYPFAAGDIATATRLNTRSTAIADLQSPPRCRAWQNAAQTLTTAVFAVVALDTEDIDTEAIHSTVTNNSRMTIVTPGRYRCIAQASFAGNVTGLRYVGLTKNSTAVARTQASAAPAANNGSWQCAEEILCAVGDFIEMQVFQNSGGNLALVAGSANTFLHVVWCSIT